MEMLNQETDPEVKKQKQNQETIGQHTSNTVLAKTSN